MRKPFGRIGAGGGLARLGMTVLLVVATGLLSSCRCGFVLLNSLSNHPRVIFDVEPTLNNTSAVAVDVVLVYDKELIEPLMALSAQEWFAQRDQLRKDYPAVKKTYEVTRLELVPNQDTTLAIRDLRCARRGIVFANYFAKGDHRALFEPARRVRVALGEESFAVVDPAGSPSENP